MANPTTQVVQLNETNQLRIRLNEWKGTTKLYIQGFYTPGENDSRDTDSEGYAPGKAATIPTNKIEEFHTAWLAFYAQYTNGNGVPKAAAKQTKGKKTKKSKGKVIGTNAVDAQF